eukprot:TRINITY_DN25492_c0_g1_i1.p1 TRINITY_DN25492_c0_g1~~TRINITY_DN25492_c0_g1_i1.p1  ORF type:complete len:253 (+),score=29.62 TRINITY_DN25492_c0_g1_i1:91-849(+)
MASEPPQESGSPGVQSEAEALPLPTKKFLKQESVHIPIDVFNNRRLRTYLKGNYGSGFKPLRPHQKLVLEEQVAKRKEIETQKHGHESMWQDEGLSFVIEAKKRTEQLRQRTLQLLEKSKQIDELQRQTTENSESEKVPNDSEPSEQAAVAIVATRDADVLQLPKVGVVIKDSDAGKGSSPVLPDPVQACTTETPLLQIALNQPSSGRPTSARASILKPDPLSPSSLTSDSCRVSSEAWNCEKWFSHGLYCL